MRQEIQRQNNKEKYEETMRRIGREERERGEYEKEEEDKKEEEEGGEIRRRRKS